MLDLHVWEEHCVSDILSGKTSVHKGLVRNVNKTLTWHTLYTNIRPYIKDVNVAPSVEYIDRGICRVGDAVWIKAPHGQCIKQFKKERVMGDL